MHPTAMQKSTGAEIALQRLGVFDGALHKRGTFCDKAFPPHLHHEWSLALIETGCELLTLKNREIPLYADALVLIPPGVIHANKGNPGAHWQYRSLYLNPDAMAFVARHAGIDTTALRRMHCHITYDQALSNRFKNIAECSDSAVAREDALQTFLADILKNAASAGVVHETETATNREYADFIHYLHSNFREKQTLEQLSLACKQSKYALLRRFRALTGLTPHDYITALRVEAAKKRLLESDSLTEVALDSGFYDQSHFTHVFIKYVGISPGAYRMRCNILQD
jgi:AraC-like DNA-binding protein